MNQTPLNPDALEAAADAVIDASFGQELPEAPIDLARAAVSAYLAVAQPEVSSVEELEALPVDSVVLDRFDYPHHKCAQSTPDFKNLRTGHHISRLEFYFPARVLYRPEVNDA